MPDTPETPLVDAFPHVIGNSFTLTIGGSASCWPANISAGEAFTIPTGRRYTGSALFVTTNALLSFRAEAAGTITAAYLYIPTNTSATSVIFNLRKNSVAQFTGASRFIIAQGASSSSKTGLAISVALGDLIELSLEQVPSIGVLTPVEFIIRTASA